MVILLNPSNHHDQSRPAMLRVFQRLQGACQEGDWFFPRVAETSSIGGQRGNKEWEGVHTKHKIVVGVISVRTEQNLIWHLLSTYIQ